ncbi:MAG: prephenate dehydrogenase [Gammaproteobacteria bacterium]
MNNVVICGIGLIGGSIAKGLSKDNFNVYVIDSNHQSKNNAIKNKHAHEAMRSVEEVKKLEDAIFIFATPPKTTLEILKKNEWLLSSKFSVTDVTSVKTELVKYLIGFGAENFILSHPISGSHLSGFENSSENLFVGKTTIISSVGSSKFHLDRIQNLWGSLNSNVIELDYQNHDKLFSLTSHLPHFVAYSLMKVIYDNNIDVNTYAGGGLKDFIRLSQSSPEMWGDIFQSNTYLDKHIDELVEKLIELKELSSSKDSSALKEYLSQFKQ